MKHKINQQHYQDLLGISNRKNPALFYPTRKNEVRPIKEKKNKRMLFGIPTITHI